MTFPELKQACEERIKDPIFGNLITLAIPGRAYGNTKRFPGLGVRGEIVCEFENECLCAFDAQEILNALERKSNELRVLRKC